MCGCHFDSAGAWSAAYLRARVGAHIGTADIKLRLADHALNFTGWKIKVAGCHAIDFGIYIAALRIDLTALHIGSSFGDRTRQAQTDR
jgi:hypothetical protein